MFSGWVIGRRGTLVPTNSKTRLER